MKNFRQKILIQAFLLLSSLTVSFPAWADLNDIREKRPLRCDDRGQLPIEGEARDLQALAEKSCSEFNTASDSSSVCHEAIEDCVAEFKNSFWQTIREYRGSDQCMVVRFGHYFRCTPCTYEEVLRELTLVIASEKTSVEAACHCGNGQVDSGEACDPSSPGLISPPFQCTSQCTLIVVDPTPPSNADLGGERPEADPLTGNGDETPAVPDNAGPKATGKFGLDSANLGGCSLAVRGAFPTAFSQVIFLMPMIMFILLRKKK